MSARDARATPHYFDSTFNYQAVKVLPNEYYVTGDDVMITTALGSCVAACIRDPQTGVGGMNHFMLPEGDSQSPASATIMSWITNRGASLVGASCFPDGHGVGEVPCPKRQVAAL
jgi:hypothetical protein